MPGKFATRRVGDRSIPAAARTAAWLRLGCFVLAAGAIGLMLLRHRARAQINEALLELGAQMMEFPGTLEEAREIRINGVRVWLRTQTVDAPLPEVLDHYEKACEKRDAGLSEQLAELVRVHTRRSSSLSAISAQSNRSQSNGYVACMDMGSVPQDLGALAERFVRFARTWDLQEIGGLRYAYARRHVASSGQRTFVLTMWADSAFDLRRVLPLGNADAEGHDMLGLPRPLGAQRILSAWEADRPSGVYVYLARGRTMADLESFYRKELPKHGWTIIERHAGESIRIDDVRMLSARKGEDLVTVLSHVSGARQIVLTLLASEAS
jgi:hypothetical protein